VNRIQEAIAAVTGIDQELEHVQSSWQSQMEVWESERGELREALEHIDSQNALLQRQIEDIDYLNLFDIGGIMEVIPMANRKNTINRLRRLRQENPLAKQAVKLITRFTLGKGIEIIVGPDPATKIPLEPLVDGEAPDDLHKANGLFPGNKPSPPPNPNAKRPRPQVSEALDDLVPYSTNGSSKIDTKTAPGEEQVDELKRIVDAFWCDDDNKRALTDRAAMNEWLDQIATDGEKFMVGFTSPGGSYIKLTEIPMEEIDTIIYDPNNWKKPVYYMRTYIEKVYDGQARAYVAKDGNPKTKYYLDYRILDEELADLRTRIKIPAKELAPDDKRIKHSMINPLWTKKGKRGISELYASREWFRVYKEFMEDRAAINAAATSVAYKRKIKGGPTAVAGMSGKFGGLNVGYDNPELGPSETNKLSRPVAGATYDSNPAVDLEWMKTDTGAVNAKEDGRSILTAAGAGTGMFVHYFGDGGDANLATAQAMELPMVKTFEDWQQWLEDELIEFIGWVIRVATDDENAKKQISRIAGSFPPIISQDVVKFMTAWSQLVQNVAPGNRVVHREAIKGSLTVMNVPNIDSLMTEIDAEEKQLELQKKQQQQDMLDALAEQPVVAPAVRDGSGQPDPAIKQTSRGKPQPQLNGGKPPR